VANRKKAAGKSNRLWAYTNPRGETHRRFSAPDGDDIMDVLGVHLGRTLRNTFPSRGREGER